MDPITFIAGFACGGLVGMAALFVWLILSELD